MHFIGSALLESLSLWERWQRVSVDGEGKPGTKEPLRSDGQALCQRENERCTCASPPAALPSQALTRQLSQRESLWQAGQVSSGRAKLICFVDCSALLSRPAALPSQALRASSPKGRAFQNAA